MWLTYVTFGGLNGCGNQEPVSTNDLKYVWFDPSQVAETTVLLLLWVKVILWEQCQQ